MTSFAVALSDQSHSRYFAVAYSSILSPSTSRPRPAGAQPATISRPSSKRRSTSTILHQHQHQHPPSYPHPVSILREGKGGTEGEKEEDSPCASEKSRYA